MLSNYFFIDGSALTAQIRQLQRAKPEFRNRRLCPRAYLNYLMISLRALHENAYKRAIFYFPKGDESAIEDYLVIPDYVEPGAIRDINFKFCGHKLKKSGEFDKFVEESVPAKFQSRFSKSEKGIDIEMCCDALRLASQGRIERLFLFSNDGDFIPFCRTIKEFGANISILHLSSSNPPNGELLREADSYDIVHDAALDDLFLPKPAAEAPVNHLAPIGGGEPAAPAPVIESEKPDAAPSDLKILEDPAQTEEN